MSGPPRPRQRSRLADAFSRPSEPRAADIVHSFSHRDRPSGRSAVSVDPFGRRPQRYDGDDLPVIGHIGRYRAPSPARPPTGAASSVGVRIRNREPAVDRSEAGLLDDLDGFGPALDTELLVDRGDLGLDGRA